MPPFGPVKRSELIKYLRKFGFDGPYSGGKHAFMIKGDLTLTIPNPHQKDIGGSF
jgi:predicted RNA binding protein YcfA (HicA-like mRNA interferase family)